LKLKFSASETGVTGAIILAAILSILNEGLSMGRILYTSEVSDALLQILFGTLRRDD
jgi:hypothetical protein